jgi:hypothetical protein
MAGTLWLQLPHWQPVVCNICWGNALESAFAAAVLSDVEAKTETSEPAKIYAQVRR